MPSAQNKAAARRRTRPIEPISRARAMISPAGAGSQRSMSTTVDHSPETSPRVCHPPDATRLAGPRWVFDAADSPRAPPALAPASQRGAAAPQTSTWQLSSRVTFPLHLQEARFGPHQERQKRVICWDIDDARRDAPCNLQVPFQNETARIGKCPRFASESRDSKRLWPCTMTMCRAAFMRARSNGG